MASFTTQKIGLPAPAPGTSREITVYRYGTPGSRPKVYLQTALHADEIPGMLVLHHFRQMLENGTDDEAIKGEFVIVPVANPIGMAQRIQGNVSGRLDLNTGINFNRQYPQLLDRVKEIVSGSLTADESANDSLVRSAISEAVSGLPGESESQAIRKVLLELCADADYCLDLHCDSEAVMYMYSGGTHQDKAEALSTALRCRAHMVDSENTMCFDGAISLLWPALAESFPDHPISPGCMGCTLEFRGAHDVSDELAKADAEGLYRFFVHTGVLDGTDASLPEPLCTSTPLLGQTYVRSPRAGVVTFCRECGDQVAKGDLVAILVDPLAPPVSGRLEIRANNSGTLFKRSHERLIEAGHIVVGIAGKEIVPELIGTHLLSD